VRVVGFDHIVLRVADVERSLAWYTGQLGLGGVRIEEWRSGQAPFPSVRVNAETIIDLIRGEPARPGNLDHLCLVVEPCDLAAWARSGDFRVVDGPVTRFGAQGDGTSLYVLDPDDNLVELRYYGTQLTAAMSSVLVDTR
jgi:catechol 2,3-dioxygenase-like lactoylglutathione lyase family enzyme